MTDPTYSTAVLLITAGTIVALVTLATWILREARRPPEWTPRPKRTTPPPPPS